MAIYVHKVRNLKKRILKPGSLRDISPPAAAFPLPLTLELYPLMLESGLAMHFIFSRLYHVLRAHMDRVRKSNLSGRAAFDIGPHSRGTLAKFLKFLAATGILTIILFAHAAKRFVSQKKRLCCTFSNERTLTLENHCRTSFYKGRAMPN